MSLRHLVILDKNFIQSESISTTRLHALARCGCEFVISDTLLYELCSDSKRPGLWPSLQNKMFPFADRLHVWFHTSELLRQEIATNQQVYGPEDKLTTQRLRDWFRSGQVYIPPDLQKIVEKAKKQREEDPMKAVVPMARSIGKIIAVACKASDVSKPSEDDPAKIILENLNNELFIHWMLRITHGNSQSSETYIPDADRRVNKSWFAFHNARSNLALVAIFLQKYGFAENPGKKFPNTKLDADYLAILHYAEAIASDETSGDMATMIDGLYSASKKQITSKKLLSSIPREDEVRLAAYQRWEGRGRTEGNDVKDWLDAETSLYEMIWSKL